MNLAILVILAMLSTPKANEIPSARASWTPPITGGPVEHYVLQLHYFDEDSFFTIAVTPDTSVVVPVHPLRWVEARVCGVNTHPETGEERQGPWSDVSDPYIYDPGPPDIPGQPEVSDEDQ
jgi:hypothetical protein